MVAAGVTKDFWETIVPMAVQPMKETLFLAQDMVSVRSKEEVLRVNVSQAGLDLLALTEHVCLLGLISSNLLTNVSVRRDTHAVHERPQNKRVKGMLQ